MVPELTEQEVKGVHIHLLENYFGSSAAYSFIREWILNNSWGLILNFTHIPFITSDNPFYIGRFIHKDRLNGYFPLSPELLLVFYPKTHQVPSYCEITPIDAENINKTIFNLSDEIVISNSRDYLEKIISTTISPSEISENNDS